jgi:hypothetical protein
VDVMFTAVVQALLGWVALPQATVMEPMAQINPPNNRAPPLRIRAFPPTSSMHLGLSWLRLWILTSTWRRIE